MKTLMLVSIAIWTAATSLLGQSLKTVVTAEPKMNLTFVYEDKSYKFVSRDYGRHTDQGGNTEPGLFVYSKERDRWLQITEISTVDGVFGKSSLPRGDIKKLLTGNQDSWDHTSLAEQPYVKIPLQSNFRIWFPKIFLSEKDKKRYKLLFQAPSGGKSGNAALYLKGEDLRRAFTKEPKT